MARSPLLDLASQVLYPNYGPRDLVLDRGEGSVVWDTDGRRYVDFGAGIAVSTLGHAHPRLTAAIATQAGRLIHQSNLFLSEPNIRLAHKLCELTSMDRAFFCNSGTEANEAALKLARRYFFDRGETERYRIISFDGSFHGRTLGALSVTGQAKYTQGFGPTPGTTKVPFGDLGAVERALGSDVAAIITEPIQGEGGVHIAPPGFLEGLRQLADRLGSLLIIDEIQTGAGRTGSFLYSQSRGVQADVITMAKALGGGVPIGVLLCPATYENALPPGSHGTTFGGNPLASAAALAVLDVLDEDCLLDRAKTLGEQMAARFEQLIAKHSIAVAQRGLGLLRALVLADGASPKEVMTALRDAGLLVLLGGADALRFAPALTTTDAELNEGFVILDRVLGELST